MASYGGADIGGGIGELGGSIVGDIFGSGDRQRAREAYRRALEDIMNSNPEAGPSGFENIVEDPRLRQAQTTALGQIQDVARTGGLDVGSRVAMNEAAADTARRERGSREAILQNMAMRGLQGSGTELAANLANEQGAAQSNAMSGARAVADARARAYQAMSDSGQLGGQIRGQDWGQAAQKANAEDVLGRFNASQRLTRAGMAANVRMGQAGQYNNEADRWRQRGAGVGEAAGMAIGALA